MMLEGWALLAVLLIALALGLLAGAALGFYSASTDLERARAEARLEGRRSAAIEVLSSWTGAPQHPESRRLFDQDESSPAARAIELRGD